MLEPNNFPVLTGLSTGEISRFEELATKKTVKQGQIFISQNQTLNGVYFILSGRCVIYTTESDGKEFVYAELEKGELVGELSVFDGQKSAASVRALENLNCWFLETENFLKFFKSCSRFAQNIVLMLVNRLRKADDVIDKLAFLNVEQRIIAFFKERGVLKSGAITVSPVPTSAELSRYVGASREMCGRVIRGLQSSGRLIQSRGVFTLTIKD
jgi:CRP/FNR family transcriptional regulator